MSDVALVGLSVADPPERWAAVGFHVDDGRVRAHSVLLTLGIAPQGAGIVGWTLAGLERDGDVAGLRTRRVPGVDGPHHAAPTYLSLTGGIDHVVVVTPRFDALADELAERGLPLRRVAEIRGTRMGFRRLGGPTLEVVQAPEAATNAFWGVTFAVPGVPGGAGSLDELCARSRFLGEPRPAVQPGRRIAAVSREAGLSTRVAFIDPEPR
ncbi:MAG TPA: hypothetical protein VMF07_13450 [Solirubrobacteraceae bacterium]|nr:hypothetical protein [Solirubrobacteraceae bacterium]